MKDRFKFRFWNGRTMIYDDLPHLELYNCDDYIWMQSTGLKDKKDKLIYEGDIVRYADAEYDDIEDIEPQWEYDEIIWGDIFSYPAFDLKHGNLFDCNGLSYIFNQGWTIEVIGNIYENRELINEYRK